MATNKERFEHGEHNEAACKYLELSQKFPDWTITTAFYAALHFVCSKIFPFYHFIKDQKPIKFENIESWQEFKSYTSASRHELLTDLVYKYCGPINAQYEWLLSTSWHARYHNYTYDPRIVSLAIAYMNGIKRFCALSPALANAATKK